MGAVLSEASASLPIMVSSRYLRLNRYSNSARSRHMSGPHGSIGSHHCGLDVAKDGVDPFEVRFWPPLLRSRS